MNWQPQFDPWRGTAQNIGSMLMRQPYMAAMGQQRMATAEYQRAHADYERAATAAEGAKARLTNAQAQDAEGENTNDTQLAGALKRLTLNPDDTDAQGDVISGFGRAYKKNPDGTAKAMGQLFAQFQARTGGTNYENMAVLQGDAAKVAELHKPAGLMHVSPGSAVFDPNAAKVVFQNPSAAGADAGYETVTEDYPGDPGTPAIPGKTHWFGANEPPVPAVPPTPAKKVITKRPIPLSGVVQQPQPMAAPATNAAPAAPAMNIPPGAIAKLRAHPELKGDFEAKYGVSANQFLNQ